MRNAGLEETQAGIKIAGRNINNLRYADDNTLVAESKEELKSFLMKVKEENEKGQSVLYNKELTWMEEERERPTGWVSGKEKILRSLKLRRKHFW